MSYNHNYNFKFLITDSPPPYATDIKDLDIPPNYDTKAAQDELDNLTPEEMEAYEEGITSVIGDKNLSDALQQSAQAAAQACTNIDDMFVSLTATLVGLDKTYNESFAPGIEAVQTVYRGTVDDSQKLALDIAHYAQRYDDLILPMCADKDLTVERRQAKIQDFVDEGSDFETRADDMKMRFAGLKTTFAEFVGTFSTWADKQEEDDRKRIKELQDDIVSLQKIIDKIDIALYALYGALTLTLPATGIIAGFAGPFGPLVMAGGCILAGLELTSIVGLIIAKNIKQSEVNEKNSEVKKLQKEIQTIQATRTQLVETGNSDLQLFNDNVNALVGIWQTARNDAINVQKWLNDGAKDADVPKYMMMSIGKSAGVYRTMAAYLTGYADGVTSIL